jgi:hypothetical protein
LGSREFERFAASNCTIGPHAVHCGHETTPEKPMEASEIEGAAEALLA